MVFYFVSNVVSPPFTIFMGAEKYESELTWWINLFSIYCIQIYLRLFSLNESTDEDLIKWGWPEDVWFHVDKVSSAHVYLRLQPVSKKLKCIR